MTMEFDVEEAASWDKEMAANVIAYLNARLPERQRDLDRVMELRGGEEAVTSGEGGYYDMTNDELREELASRDLPVSGNKDELISRLEEADQG